MNGHFRPRSVLVLTLATGLLAGASSGFGLSDPERGVRSPEGASSAVFRVAGVVGSPRLIERGGEESALTVESVIGIGATIRTDEGSRAGITIGGSSQTTEDQTDVLLLGPKTAVRFASERPGVATGAERGSGGQVVVEVLEGTYRLVVRSLSGTSACVIKTANRVLELEAADVAGTFDAGHDDGRYLVQGGMAVIVSGDRKPKLKAGMMRLVKGGKIRGATRYTRDEWSQLKALTKIPGVDPTRRPKVDPRSPVAQGPAVSKPTPRKAGEVKPTEAGSDEASEPAGEGEGKYVYVRMTTSMGVIDLELNEGQAPITVGNFLSYVDDGFYDGTIFHRVIGDFMIQGGGFTASMIKKGTKAPIKNEWKNGLKNRRGTIAMARIGGQADSATSQFFINVRDNEQLDRPQARDGAAYAVFGKVVNGMDVVEVIRRVETTTKGRRSNVPVEAVVIERVERVAREAVTQ